MLKGIEVLRKRQQMKLNKKETSPFVDFDQFIPEGDLGAGAKSFVQTKGWYLHKFFEDIRSKHNNSYVTCVDDLLSDKNTTEEEFKNFSVSSILHIADKKAQTFNSLYSARLANILGIRTQYVAPHKTDIKKYISIDFLKGKETIENFYEFTGLNKYHLDAHYGMPNTLQRWLQPLDASLRNKLKPLTDTKRTQVYKDIMTDFIKLYFFKKYVIMDSDLAGKNFGFVHSKPDYSDAVVSPAYDYEYSFYYPNMQFSQSEMKEDFKFLFDFNHGMFSAIQNYFDVDLKPGSKNHSQIHAVFEEFPDKDAEEKFRIVINNLLTMKGTFNAVQNSSSPKASYERWLD